MSRLAAKNVLFNPFLAWSDLVVKSSEMMIASARVISHRTGRMATAGIQPTIHDQREFALMGQEKIEAAAESAQAMALQMMVLNPALGLRAMDLMMKSSSAMLSLATSTNISQSMYRQAELGHALMESVKATSQLTGSAAKIAQRGLRPIHARATANAKRLTNIDLPAPTMTF